MRAWMMDGRLTGSKIFQRRIRARESACLRCPFNQGNSSQTNKRFELDFGLLCPARFLMAQNGLWRDFLPYDQLDTAGICSIYIGQSVGRSLYWRLVCVMEQQSQYSVYSCALGWIVCTCSSVFSQHCNTWLSTTSCKRGQRDQIQTPFKNPTATWRIGSAVSSQNHSDNSNQLLTPTTRLIPRCATRRYPDRNRAQLLLCIAPLFCNQAI